MVTFTLSQSVYEFAKLRAMRVMRASVAYVPTCQTRANFSFLCANVPVNVSTCQSCANFSTWHANVANDMPICYFCVPTCQFFKHSSYEMLREISLLYYFIKNSTLYLMSYLYIWSAYVSYSISILHVILKKSVRNCWFLELFCSLVKNENTKRPGFYT